MTKFASNTRSNPNPLAWLSDVRPKLASDGFGVAFLLAKLVADAAERGEEPRFPAMAELAAQASLPEFQVVKTVARLIACNLFFFNAETGGFSFEDEIPF